MDNRDLRRLSKTELLTIICEQKKQIDAQRDEIEDLNGQLENKKIIINNSGSIAEAALKLNNVFETAQRSVEQYLENITDGSVPPEIITASAEGAVSDGLLQDTREQYTRMTLEAQQSIEERWSHVKELFDEYLSAHLGLAELLESLGIGFEDIFM